MNIIGINDTHDSSCCYFKDGHLIFAAAEERFQRIKNMSSFPIKSLSYLIKQFKIKPNEIDFVAVANENVTNTNLWNIVNEFSVNDFYKLHTDYFYEYIYNNKKIKLREIFPNYFPKGKIYYPLNKIPFVTSMENKKINNLNKIRQEYISKFLKVEKNKIYFFNHHRCHGYYGYFMNKRKYKKYAIVTSDGGGDGKYDSVSTVKNGKIKLISSSRTSLVGKIYSSITLLLGMHPHRHHYKVMGLAPYASKYKNKEVLKIFSESLNVSGLKFKKNKEMKDFFFYFKEKLKTFRFDTISYGIQKFTENVLTTWFKNISKKTHINNFIFSGGVANNVKANKIILENRFTNSLFVPPGPGDENLSIGAACCLMYDKLGHVITNRKIKYQTNAFWGYEISYNDLINFSQNKLIRKFYKSKKDQNFKLTAKRIKKGEIVALCMGKAEFGSRALGHRSFICDPSNIEAKERLNAIIKKRDFWMPFTPSILDKYFKRYILVNKKNFNASFMTCSFNTTSLGREKLIAAIHPKDFTARPQFVEKSTCLKYYKLISEFSKLSGIGALLNTSLNVHEKPIINNGKDIINEFIKKGQLLENIYFKDTLFTLKKSSTTR